MKQDLALDVNEVRQILAEIKKIVLEISRDITQLANLETLQDEDIMDWFKISRKTLYNHRRNRKIPYSKIGGRVVYIKILVMIAIFNQSII